MRILLYQGISLKSRFVRFQTRSKYSHAALELTDMTVVEALFMKGVVRANSFETNHTHGTKVDVFSINDVNFNHVEAEQSAIVDARAQIPYDNLSILRFLSHTPARENGKYFCSEHVLEKCLVGGVTLQRGDTAQMPPRDVWRSMAITKIEEKIVL